MKALFVLAIIFISNVLFLQFPTTSSTVTTDSSKNSNNEIANEDVPKQQEDGKIKLSDPKQESFESIIDEEKGIVLKIIRPKNNTLWRFVEGIKYSKQDFLAGQLLRLQNEEDVEQLYSLMKLYIRVFSTELLEHLYKKEKFKNWKEFWKKLFFDYELGNDPQKSPFVLEKTKIEKELVDASYKIGGKKSKVIEYQIVGPPQRFPNISVRVRAVIFKDKQYTIVFRTLSQVVGKELTQTLEKELLEILDKTTFIQTKVKKK